MGYFVIVVCIEIRKFKVTMLAFAGVMAQWSSGMIVASGIITLSSKREVCDRPRVQIPVEPLLAFAILFCRFKKFVCSALTIWFLRFLSFLVRLCVANVSDS